jgi:hypothetical protein
MSDTLQEQLKRWRDKQPQPSNPKQQLHRHSLGLIKPTRHTGKHALKTYKGIVEFPHTRGGGIMWLKSASALTKYQDLNYKVVWL